MIRKIELQVSIQTTKYVLINPITTTQCSTCPYLDHQICFNASNMQKPNKCMVWPVSNHIITCIVSHLSWRGVGGRQRTVADWTLPQTGGAPNQWSWTTYSVSISSKSRFTYDIVFNLQNLHHTSHAHGNGDPHPQPQYSIETPVTPWCTVSLTCTCVGVVGGCRNRGMEERMGGGGASVGAGDNMTFFCVDMQRVMLWHGW